MAAALPRPPATIPYEQVPATVFTDFTVNADGSLAIVPLSLASIPGAGDPVTDT